jgi:heterotetrameric sarcosine oxidase gamma subunit
MNAGMSTPMNAPVKATIRCTPLYETAQRLGARFVELGQWRFPEVYTSVEAEIAAVRAGCGLADVSPHGKVQIEGEAAFQALAAAFGQAPEATGAGVAVASGHLYRLRRDLFFLSTPPGGEAEALARITTAVAQQGAFVTATDLSHALSDLRLIGPASAQVLAKVCGLDFRPAGFPDRTAKYSSLAKTRQLIVRRDFGALPAYTFLGDASLAAYVWGVVMEAGREFGIQPVGVGALRVLETV